MKMSVADKIKNPEVPGLECLLPPPPPPPPPPKISVNESYPPPGVPTPVPPPGGTFGHPTGPYYPGIAPPVLTHSQTTPWWIPTDADSTDAYNQWYHTPYKPGATPVVAPVTPTPPVEKSKTKNKFLKRKIDPIDPHADAEKVASAQRELSSLMKPLKCDLCNAVMNSTLQAKRHYDGKPHQKKVSMFLNQNAKKLKVDDGQVSSTTGNDWNSYCEICKTWFTSQMDAAQHYAGKKHIKASHGIPRTSPQKKKVEVPAGVFKPPETAATVVPVPVAVPVPVPVPPPVPTTPLLAPPIHYSQPAFPTTLHCDLCGVSANREDQLETHKRGARHIRMLRLNGLPVPDSVPETPSAQPTPGPIDYSIYRTPSGQYYCAPCNLSLNSEINFAQHIESKKHRNQVNPKVQPTPVTPSKKSHKKK